VPLHDVHSVVAISWYMTNGIVWRSFGRNSPNELDLFCDVIGREIETMGATTWSLFKFVAILVRRCLCLVSDRPFLTRDWSAVNGVQEPLLELLLIS
jgi:hypothetical protein